MATKKDARKEIGKHLQALRKSAGYTSAKAFAISIGFNPNTYTQYEQGISGFNYEQAWLMADALHCSMDELGGRAWPPEGEGPAALDRDERGLVEAYRRMHDDDRPGFVSTANALAFAGDAKKEDAARLPHLGEWDLTRPRRTAGDRK